MFHVILVDGDCVESIKILTIICEKVKKIKLGLDKNDSNPIVFISDITYISTKYFLFITLLSQNILGLKFPLFSKTLKDFSKFRFLRSNFVALSYPLVQFFRSYFIEEALARYLRSTSSSSSQLNPLPEVDLTYRGGTLPNTDNLVDLSVILSSP